MDNCINQFKNTLTSFSHANFRLDTFHCKILLGSTRDCNELRARFFYQKLDPIEGLPKKLC